MNEAGKQASSSESVSPAKSWPAVAESMLEPMYRFVRARVPTQAVDDLVQETFAAATRGLKQFDGRCPLWNWLTAIARNKIAEYYRRSGSSKAVLLAADALADEEKGIADAIASGKPLPEEICQRREFESLARAALSGLEPQHRDCLVARYYEDLSLEDLARRFEISRAAANARLHRARQELREAFVQLLARRSIDG